MTMSEAALDLSISSFDAASQKASRHHDHVSNDSGRASSDSTLSDMHEEIKVRLRPSPQVTPIHTTFLGENNPSSGRAFGCPQFSSPAQIRSPPELPSHIQLKHTSLPSPVIHTEIKPAINYSNPNSPGQAETGSGDDETKPHLLVDRVADPRVAPIRPFKMYPVDPFNVYGNPLMAGTGTLPTSPVSLQSLYDTASPVAFSTFPLTSLTSHLLQRKRRAENRESSTVSSATTTAGSTTVNSSSSSASGAPCAAVGIGSMMVSTSSPGSSKDDSAGSDSEKRAKFSAEVKKDDAYWDRRRKNNEAAKRSRDARRQKEEEIAMRAAFLEQENLKLRAQVAILKNETAKLHYMLYNRM